MSDDIANKKRSLEENGEAPVEPAPKRDRIGESEGTVEAGGVPAIANDTTIPDSTETASHSSASPSPARSGSPVADSISELQRRRPKAPIMVLVVDDSATVRKITKAKLEEAGYQVEVASNGEEALGKYVSHSPGYYNIILLDIYMPVLDGVRLANIIREREALEAVGNHQVIIGLSAETRDITVDIMDSCLLKPFDLEAFESCVRLYHIH